MKFLLMIFLLLLAQGAFSTEEDCEEETPKIVQAVMNAAKTENSKGCADQKKLENLCYSISNMEKLPNPIGKVRFEFQKKFLEASCANAESDSPEVIQAKVQKMWLQLRDKMVCNSISFDVENGSIIKFAVALKFDEFIYHILKWKIDLNKVDPSDNRTVLDYIQRQIERNKGNSLEPTLQSYYNRLKAAGAKHRSEL